MGRQPRASVAMAQADAPKAPVTPVLRIPEVELGEAILLGFIVDSPDVNVPDPVGIDGLTRHDDPLIDGASRASWHKFATEGDVDPEWDRHIYLELGLMYRFEFSCAVYRLELMETQPPAVSAPSLD